ncbi:TonB-dependent receptor domain-containing protein [Sphingomonas jatrophae]|uniref:TonB-dependent Receptor Plug Domain n=1 Tax=Sphingomonas jatrophae TaxID=1166337 RepID=A0A1I6LCG3_9SPHN|nr:TonB-dependent receptor [Sphingomonas jatrophae]SFS01114.1 TonB-dependent Receptor Plug Domain [Sphingomonas jatrophae]
MLKSSLLAASALAAGAIFLPGAASAQVTSDPTGAAADAAKASATAVTEPSAGPTNGPDAAGSTDTIVVTGSRIRRPNLESGAPITTVTGDEFFQTGQVSIGDVLNELPQLRSTFSQQNSTRFLGTRGLNLLDLRGLGSQRTLVLVNGRRHVPGDVLNNAVSPDVNTFPTDLIERVDLLTGSGATVYGSDAIAGAVNFVLKQDYEGVQVRGQTGISKYGDAGNQYASILAGTNFADGRGNIAFNAEIAHQQDYYASGRKELRTAKGFVVVDSDPAGATNGSDGVPDRTVLSDIRSTTISLGGLVNLAQGTACGRDATNAAYNCTYLFQSDGRLVPQTGQRVGLAPNGSFIGGNGYSGREGRLVALSPELKRYSANLIGHFEVSPAFVPFFEAKYVRTEAQGSQSGPFFTQGAQAGDTFAGQPGGRNRELIRLDNPYLSAQARDTIIAARDANGQTSNGATTFALRRNWLDLGIRDEKITRETYRGVVGVRGDLGGNWNYEVSANYGEHREKNQIIGNVNKQRYLLSVDTVRNAQGQIVCRSQVDPTQAGTDRGGNAANLAADIAACVPLNPFGEGSATQANRDYLLVDSRASGKITQFVASGFISGDSSEWFELPGGGVGATLGAEYRRETVRYDLDPFTQAGYAFYNSIPSFSAPSFEVKEVYGELRVPLLKDMTFFQELTVTGSGRIADYKGSTGTVYSYGGEIVWKPIEDLRLRGSYTRAIRAPNLTELYSAQGQNFTPAPNDPCSARNLATGSATRVANCNAAGRPANYDFVYTSSLEIVSGGNPNLTEEKSDNYTVGGVLTPRFIPGLSLSVDYFDITVKDVITSVDAQDILNNCYDAADLNNPFCASFQRAGATGGPAGVIPFQVIPGSLLVSSLNFAKLKVRGIDSEIAYRHTFDFGTIGLRANYTRYIQNDQFLDPSDPRASDRILGEVGDPKNRIVANANIKRGKVTFGYQFRWIGKQLLGEAENTVSHQGNPPQNADYADVSGYPNIYYHDVRLDYEVSDKFNIYFGADNITNRLPPYGGTGIGAGLDNVGVTGLFDNRGRYFYGGVVAKF